MSEHLLIANVFLLLSTKNDPAKNQIFYSLWSFARGGGGGGGALTCIGGTGTCRFDDPLFHTPIAALKIPDFQ